MKGQQLPLDIISTLPPTIIETILCLLPIRDAVRTSILSRKWRYNWVNIPQLEFHEDQLFKVSINKNQLSKRCNLFYTIHQVLLLHNGPILDFALYMSTKESCSEIDQIILHLLKNNTLKKFMLVMNYCTRYKLPSSFFLLNQLTHLNLQCCKLLLPSTFNGFGSLTSLYLDNVVISTKMLVHFISNCPLLRSFTLIDYYHYVLTEGDSTIIQLLECLPLVEYLCMNIHMIEIDDYDRSSELVGLIEVEDYSDIWLDHLTEFKIVNFSNCIIMLQFLKLIFVKSPMLKRVHIVLDYDVSSEEELKMLRMLLRLPCASQVEIIVSRP